MCPRRNVPDFGRVLLMQKYTDITQNSYVQCGTVTEIMARETWDLLSGPHTVPVGWQSYPFRPWMLFRMTRFQLTLATELHCVRNALRALHKQYILRLLCEWLAGSLYSVTKVLFVFSHVEHCDMHFVYGFCDGNARAADQEYQRRSPDRRIPSRSVFTRIQKTLRHTGSLPSFSLQSEREVVRTINTRIKAHP